MAPEPGVPLDVEVVRAWPRRDERIVVRLADGATVADALRASGWSLDDISGFAVFGQRVLVADPIHDGDRLEFLRPLQIDPKDARRRRARRK
jgi:putative ubiquitin-RnfH superfamily antitoxin RatB of RatAB toxin-antitoxin module